MTVSREELMRFALSLIFLLASTFVFLVGAHADDVKLVPESVRACDVPCPRIAVIFFHGFTGSRTTWLNNNQFYWPSALGEDQTIGAQLDVYRIDYPSTLRSGPSFDDIERAVGAAIDPLMIQRQYQKVVLIGHSMGGIIAQAYLMHVKERYGHRALARFPFLVTLATPFEGSSLANLGRLVVANPQIRILVPIDQNDFQRFINHMWQDVALKHLACDAHPNDNGTGLTNYAAFEGAPTVGIGIIVSRESATAHASNSIEIDQTHIGIAKPANRSDRAYAWVRDALVDCARAGSSLCRVPTEACPTGDFPVPSP
jgi:pimeloyl-ACP methyl ester carboxylesterase